GVHEGDGVLGGGDGNPGLRIWLINRGSGSLGEAEFFTGVSGVGDQLADEDLLIRVERVNDNIEQLLDLSLKVMFFGRTHKDLPSTKVPGSPCQLFESGLAAHPAHRMADQFRAILKVKLFLDMCPVG